MSLVGNELALALDSEMGANAEQIGIKHFLDTGVPELNQIISGMYDGGMPEGRIVEVFGPASCGKTFLATMVMKACQQAGGIAFFADHERSFETVLAQSLGLDLSPDKFRYMRPLHLEQSMDTAAVMARTVREKGLIPEDAPMVFVIDSIASAPAMSKLFDDKGNRREIGAYKMNDALAKAKALSQTLEVMAGEMGDHGMLLLCLNQIRMKPGVMYGDPTTTPGGQAMEFYASTRLSIGRKEITNGKKGADKEVLGFSIIAKTVKNKVARPFLKATWQVRFNVDGLGVAIDQVATNLDFLVRKGLVEKAGSYCVWEGKKYYQSALEKLLKADPKGLEKLMALYPDGEQLLLDSQESDVLPEGASFAEPEESSIKSKDVLDDALAGLA